MSFDLLAIGIFSAAAIIYSIFVRPGVRAWFLMIASIVAIYWLQPPLPIRFSDFILPTMTILLTGAGWWFTRLPDEPQQQSCRNEDRWAIALTALIVVGLSLFRFVEAEFRITASRPPSPVMVIIVLAAFGLTVALLTRVAWPNRDNEWNQNRILTISILAVVFLFLVIKSEPAGEWVSSFWRRMTGQDLSLAAPSNLAWLGFSFVAFRLIHTFRDRQMGILPVLSFREYITYVIFFPSYTAGPIDRAERFVTDFRELPNLVGPDAGRYMSGFRRILTGLVKKFVVADMLAQGMVLTVETATQSDSTLWLWVLLYGYGMRLYFDFAGYTDIAIGIGILFGVKLPENFDRPYLKTDITSFWQSWHITLSNWVRYYVFSPLSRWLLRQSWRPSSTAIVLISQLSTMAVIGLWHGITWNFFIWGLWHGLGLFVHKIWSNRSRKWYRLLGEHPSRRRSWTFVSWLITFNYVILGWVWFALPTVSLALDTFANLFGVGGN